MLSSKPIWLRFQTLLSFGTEMRFQIRFQLTSNPIFFLRVETSRESGTHLQPHVGAKLNIPLLLKKRPLPIFPLVITSVGKGGWDTFLTFNFSFLFFCPKWPLSRHEPAFSCQIVQAFTITLSNDPIKMYKCTDTLITFIV